MRPDSSVSLLRTAEGRRAARLLQWPRLLERVAGHCALERAVERVRRLEPFDDGAGLRELWAWVDELLRLLERGDDLPLAGFVDLQRRIGDDRSERGPLGGAALAAVGGAARALSDLVRAVHERGDRLPRTARCLRGTEDPAPLADRLQSCLRPDGVLEDHASARLGALREQARAAEARLRDTARQEMRRAVERGWTQGPEIVLRGDRFCVPVRAGARGRLPGIVHDRSGSGETLFVEPAAVVEAGNAFAEARLAVEEEERRILLELNRAVADHAPALLDLFERAVEIDTVRARARFGRAIGGRLPEATPAEGSKLRLEGFRHPLLAESLEAAGRGEDLVPLDLRLDDDRILVVSGPNAGGKTVALKSLGLAVLMAQAAIPLPCAHPPLLPRVDHLLLDLGDEQSIQDALSSFSAHLTHLKAILDLATRRSLVLLDEVGGGTDPQEGVALARAVLEHLADTGCRTLVTTHYGQLKALVEEDRRFRHASMSFDHAALRPRFRLRLDLPGASHALEIAGRIGLPAEVLQRATELVGDDRLRLDRLLRDLERSRDAQLELERDLRRQLDEAKLSRQRYDALARELKQARRERLREAERQAEGIVRNARRKVEALLRSIREAGGSEAAVEAARQARREIEERVQRLEQQRPRKQSPVRPPRLVEGALVRHTGLGKVGRVVDLRGDRITLQIGDARVVARAEQLAAPDDEEARREAQPVEGSIRTHIVDASPVASTRVDVRGCDVEDAWNLVDRAIDRCMVTGMRELEVIHGKGSGRLRSALGRRLAEDPRVSESRLGEGEHDDGVTLVRI